MRYVSPYKVVEEHLQNNPKPSWDIAIMCFHSKKKTKKIAEKLGGKLLGYRVFSKCDEHVVYEAVIGGEKIGILGWCTGGGPLTASLIEELNVLDVKIIIALGAAASINKFIRKNQMIALVELLVNDGTSKQYIKERPIIHINPYILKSLRKVLENKNIEVKEVKGATIEALYRQDEALLKPLRNEGCEIVNWEITPFYAVSEVCNIKCLWLGHISDVELEEVWDDWYCDRDKQLENELNICEELIKLFIEDVKVEKE